MLRTFSQCEYRMLNIFYFRAQCTCYIHLFSLKHDFFYSTTCYVNNCYWIQQHFYIKQIWFFLKIYRSSIFRKYIVHFFVTTVLFWRSNFQIRMYHKKLHILFTIARLKNKKILLFFMFINFAWTPSTIFLIFLKAEFLILYSQSSFALLYTSSPFSFNCLKPLTVN